MHKSMKHKFLAGIAVIVLIAVLLAVSCAPAKPPETIVMRYSCGLPPLHWVCTEMMPSFASEIEQRTGGSVKIELYPGAELYKHDEVVDAVTTGAVDIALNSPGHWAGRNPTFSFAGYFFVLTSGEQWLKAQDEVEAIMEAVYEEQGAKLLHFVHYGSVGIQSVMPIEKPEDVKGEKVRAPIPPFLESLEVLGATPVKLASAEAYDALAKGAIVGVASGFSSMYTRKWYEVAKYAIGPTHWDLWFTTMNLARWNSLPKDIQQVFIEVGQEMGVLTIERGEAFDAESMDALKQKGVTIIIFTPQEEAAWTALVEPAYQKWVEQCEAAGYGDEARELLKIFKAAK